jgi:hypothetical protein
MKKLILKILFLSLVIFAPVSVMAEVSVHIGIPLPPPIIFPAPPEVVVIPETDVYAVPDAQEDIFFSAGWWWRPWEGRWYRSRYYDRGWGYYRGAPSFYRSVPRGWRNDYRDHMWRGHRWDSQRIPHQDLQRNWNGWQRNRHWEKQNAWGVQGMTPGRRDQRPGEMRHQPGPAQSREMRGPQGRTEVNRGKRTPGDKGNNDGRPPEGRQEGHDRR